MDTLVLKADQVSAGILCKNARHVSTVTTARSSAVQSLNISKAKHTALDFRNSEIPYYDLTFHSVWAYLQCVTMVNDTPRPIYPRERDSLPIVEEAGWAPGPVWTSAEILATTRIWSPDRPARSGSLYRLSYPGPLSAMGTE